MIKSEFKIKKGFVFQKTANDTTIFDSNKSELISFNETAAFIFQKIKKGLDTKQIYLELLKQYDVGEKMAKSEVKKFIFLLKKKGVIV